MKTQSTNHILMIEPANFHANPETIATNSHQASNPKDTTEIQRRAVVEHQNLRNRLIERGVKVTVLKGQMACPDDLFCNNWISTHSGEGSDEAKMVLYPMLASNRRLERRQDLIDDLKLTYRSVVDLSPYEVKGEILEGTGSLVLDRVNKIAYAVQSPRTEVELTKVWCQKMGYEPVIFDCSDGNGKPEYHTNVVMYIGSDLAAICLDNCDERDRERVRNSLAKTHKLLLLTSDQIKNFCGNALEVKGAGDKKYLVMSDRAKNALTADQVSEIKKYYEDIISSDLETIEKYGGGSARCMMLELF